MSPLRDLRRHARLTVGEVRFACASVVTVSAEARRLQKFLFTAPVWWLRPVMWLVAGATGTMLPGRTAKQFGIYPCTRRGGRGVCDCCAC